MTNTRRDQEHFSGCLLGGAIGDALGAPLKFLSLAEIRHQHGPDGFTDVSSSAQLEFTDDTQMTLFTAEGLLRSNPIRSQGNLPSTFGAVPRIFAMAAHAR